MAYHETSWQNGENKDTTSLKTQIPRLRATTQLNHKTCNRRTQSFGVMRSKTKRQTSEWISQCDQVRQFENHTDSNGETSSILSKDRQSSSVILFWVEVRLFYKTRQRVWCLSLRQCCIISTKSVCFRLFLKVTMCRLLRRSYSSVMKQRSRV